MSTDNNSFVFNKTNLKKAENLLSKYPVNRKKSALLPLLDLAQRQNNGYLSHDTIEYIAGYLSQPVMHVYEAATFYSMYNTKPVGKYHIQVCGTTPCWLGGAAEIMEKIEECTKTKCGKSSSDGMFTVSEVECLGACTRAPVVQINDDYHEILDKTKVKSLIDQLKKKQ